MSVPNHPMPLPLHLRREGENPQLPHVRLLPTLSPASAATDAKDHRSSTPKHHRGLQTHHPINTLLLSLSWDLFLTPPPLSPQEGGEEENKKRKRRKEGDVAARRSTSPRSSSPSRRHRVVSTPTTPQPHQRRSGQQRPYLNVKGSCDA